MWTSEMSSCCQITISSAQWSRLQRQRLPQSVLPRSVSARRRIQKFLRAVCRSLLAEWLHAYVARRPQRWSQILPCKVAVVVQRQNSPAVENKINTGLTVVLKENYITSHCEAGKGSQIAATVKPQHWSLYSSGFQGWHTMHTPSPFSGGQALKLQKCVQHW